MRNFLTSIPSSCFALFSTIAVFSTSPASAADLTGDLFVLDDNSNPQVLRIELDGTVSTILSESDITTVTGRSGARFSGNGITWDGTSLYFTENTSESVLKFDGTTLSVLTTEADIFAVTGESSANPEGIAFNNNFLFVQDDDSDDLLKIDPLTGTVSLFTTKEDFEALANIDMFDNSWTLSGGKGALFAASDDNPQAVFSIAKDGTPTLIASDSPFGDLDEGSTIAPNGDFIVFDDSEKNIYRVTPDGDVSVFLSELQILAVTGDNDTEITGMAFDPAGNFYAADEESGVDSILKWSVDNLSAGTIDPNLGSIFVSEDDIETATGFSPDLDGGMVFAVAVPEPSSILGVSVAIALGKIFKRNTNSQN